MRGRHNFLLSYNYCNRQLALTVLWVLLATATLSADCAVRLMVLMEELALRDTNNLPKVIELVGEEGKIQTCSNMTLESPLGQQKIENECCTDE